MNEKKTLEVGDIAVFTKKETPTKYFYGLVVYKYNATCFQTIVLEGNVNFKYRKNWGITKGKYINLEKYNYYCNTTSEVNYSQDYIERTIDRPYKHISYTIMKQFTEIYGVYQDTQFSFVLLTMTSRGQTWVSGGFFRTNKKYKRNDIVNRARAQAEINLQKRFSHEEETSEKNDERE